MRVLRFLCFVSLVPFVLIVINPYLFVSWVSSLSFRDFLLYLLVPLTFFTFVFAVLSLIFVKRLD
jgi:hypothetical protein